MTVTWRQLLALMAGVLLIVAAGAAMAQQSRPVRCYPRPQGPPPADAEVYYGTLAQQLIDTLAPQNHLPPIASIVVETRGPDVVVVLLSGDMACPIPVERGEWQAAWRTVLGEVV